MAIENADTFDQLNIALPDGGNDLNEGDNHARLLKHVLKFVMNGVNGNGFNIPITTTETEMDYLVGVTSNIQSQLDDIQAGEVPVGGIVSYTGVFGNIPSSYRLCDGTNGTPNLVDMFIYDAQNNTQSGQTGGSADQAIVDHSHTATHGHTNSTGSVGNHTHNLILNEPAFGVPPPVATKGGATNATHTVDSGGGHTHSLSVGSTQVTVQSGASGTGKNLPPFYTFAFIMRIN